MPLLLDTHVWLWATMAPERLNVVARIAIETQTELVLFVGSLWEMAIKIASGKLRIVIRPEHALAAAASPAPPAQEQHEYRGQSCLPGSESIVARQGALAARIAVGLAESVAMRLAPTVSASSCPRSLTPAGSPWGSGVGAFGQGRGAGRECRDCPAARLLVAANHAERPSLAGRGVESRVSRPGSALGTRTARAGHSPGAGQRCAGPGCCIITPSG